MALFRRLLGPPVHQRQSMTFEDLLRDFGAKTSSGVTVGSEQALRLSAVWACIRLLSDTISTLPIEAYREGSKEPIRPKPQILTRPAAYTDFTDWCYQCVSCVLLQGNVFGQIVEREGAGFRPSQVELLAPGRATVQLNPDRLTWQYRIDGREVAREEVFHFRGYSFPGNPNGLSPVAYAAESIGVGLASQQYAGSFFGQPNDPGGYLATDFRLDPVEAERMLRAWVGAHAGQRRIAIFEAGLKFVPLYLPDDQAQFLNSRKFSVQEVARIYAIPPELIGAESGTSQTYANVSERTLGFYRFAVNPWLVRLETALSNLLPRGTYAKFDTSALLRSDTKTRFEAYRIALGDDKHPRWMDPGEVRAFEDLPPLPDQQASEPPRKLKAVP